MVIVLFVEDRNESLENFGITAEDNKMNKAKRKKASVKSNARKVCILERKIKFREKMTRRDNRKCIGDKEEVSGQDARGTMNIL